MIMKGQNYYSIIEISDEEFSRISRLVYDKFGINLTAAKRELVKGRLNKILRQEGFENFSSYYEHVINDLTGVSLMLMIDKLSTNHSFFYRESDHFDFLRTVVLPDIVSRKNELRIWCAGCAYGEEAYTLSMVVNDFLDDNPAKIDAGILATDISTTALKRAIDGIYPAERTSKLPDAYRFRYLDIIDRETVKIRDEIKDMILFKRLNLMSEIFPFRGKFDIIFCRNVMIYFDNRTRMNLVGKLYSVMNEASYLFIGHSESLVKETTLFRYIKPAVYYKN